MNAPVLTPTEPDWEKLEAIASRAGTLVESGEMTQELFEALLDEAESASGGNPDFVEVLAPFAPT